MSIVIEEREDILRDNNTAQQNLLDIVQGLNPNTAELHLSTELSGDIDLSVCQHLERLRTIIFGQGKITNIHNVPDKTTKLVCAGNLITDLGGLPKSIVSLDCGGNYLTSLPVLPHLEELICNDNKLDDLGTLPNTIVSIHCQNNDVKYLDLKGKTKLRTLNVSNNPLIIVENLPDTIHEYIAENNQIPASHEEANTKTKDIRKRIDYADALGRYFKLKSDYETAVREQKRKAFKRGASKKEGVKLAAAVRPKCVVCKRPVGSIFASDTNGYTALCGDTNKPCNLDIKLSRGNFEMNETILTTFRESLNDTKARIIRLKMDTLMGYITETTASKLFNRKVEEFNKDNTIYAEELARHNGLYDRGEAIQRKQDAVYQINQSIRKMLGEYENNNGIIQTVVHTYKTDLLPELENLRRLKYDIMEVELVEHENRPTMTVLRQMEVAPSKLEYVYGEQPAVLKFSV
jgi:hypothetical protein